MEGDISAHHVAAVGDAVRKARRFRQQHQPGGLDGTAGQDEDVGLLLECLAGLVLVDRGSDLATGVDDQFPDVAFRPQVVSAGGQCVWDEHVERAGPGAGRVAVLLGEGADLRCPI